MKSISFTENGPMDVVQLNALYGLIGWDNHHRRTETKTMEMLRVSQYYIAAHTHEGELVGMARVCGDPYTVQVVDVITHPDFAVVVSRLNVWRVFKSTSKSRITFR